MVEATFTLPARLAGRGPVDVGQLTFDTLMGCIDHSLLRPELTPAEVEAGLVLAIEHRCATVCVRPVDLARAVGTTSGTGVSPTTVVGFPHGSHLTTMKLLEAGLAAETGAIELDVVAAIGLLRSGSAPDLRLVESEIAAIVRTVAPLPVKVILETAYLSEEQVVAGCRAAVDAGAAFVKNGTGFSPRGATPEEIALMRRTVGPTIGVKAAGGVRTLDAALAILAAGANRFGATATASIASEWRERHPDERA